jgi:hypothetical protein
MIMATKTDYARKCQQLDVLIDLLERENKRLRETIVRCKDCKHWIPYDWMFSEVWRSKNMTDYPEDEIGCNWCDMAMKANDFCSRGERKVTE